MYQFPCHPSDMFDNTPRSLGNSTRNLRIDMIQMIARLSQTHSQEAIDMSVVIDTNANGFIIGMDTSRLNGVPRMCDSVITLGSLTSESWVTMCVSKYQPVNGVKAKSRKNRNEKRRTP